MDGWGGGWMSRSLSALPDLGAHEEQPGDGLLQEGHAVVGRDVAKHRDLIREALYMERGKPSEHNGDNQTLPSLK